MGKPTNMVASSPVEPKAVLSNRDDQNSNRVSIGIVVFDGDFYTACPDQSNRNTGKVYTSLKPVSSPALKSGTVELCN